ncbi:NAD(P)H-hydrate dehydratase [Salipaludibacillus daqingensis]|uniref:NAD(P)H-hydrate dehydratase n=1 Tax=Salipaludibacillus daqingensis TaxID=3041001 RepID=UPI002474D52D|nr:NAD(P)H-hydrate dehydratase [Salipaludibacillus daqingensis]
MYVVTGGEMHQIDRYTMDQIGLSEETLMESAGQAFVRHLLTSISKKDRVIVLIGSGNNGGDGFVIARLLAEKGFQLSTWVVPPKERIKGTAKKYMEIFERCGYTFDSYKQNRERFTRSLSECTIIVDALLGTGLKGRVRQPYDEVIYTINQFDKRVVSVDIPSGLSSNEGEEDVVGIYADETYTLQAPKVSRFLYPAASHYGVVHTLDIGIPTKVFREIAPNRRVITEERVRSTLASRPANMHKGKAGRALIIAGSETMTGAPVLATGACLRSGAGLVTMAVPKSIHPLLSERITESTSIVLEEDQGEVSQVALTNDIPFRQFDGVAIGPGLGRKTDKTMFDTLQSYDGVVVVDADGLYHMSKELHHWFNQPRSAPTVITPHMGEMAMLTGLSISELEQNRFKSSKDFATKYQMYVVLKGPFTIVTTPNGNQWVNTTGNASLAKGGSGDVLTGILLAFMLQHDSLIEAICNAVHIHGKLADEMLETHDVFSVNATDLIHSLPRVLRSYRY